MWLGFCKSTDGRMVQPIHQMGTKMQQCMLVCRKQRAIGSWARGEGGTGMGVGEAWGTSWRNLWKSNWERASAKTLEDPVTWRAVNAKECWAANIERWRSSTITFESLDVWDRNTSTTAVLSEQNSTCFADHWWPHTEAARSSLYSMDNDIWVADHTPTNHSYPRIAPYPIERGASEEIWRSGTGAHWGYKRKLWPFHKWKNSHHHVRSKWNSVEPYRVVLSVECREQINHPTKNGTACSNCFASVLKITK